MTLDEKRYDAIRKYAILSLTNPTLAEEIESKLPLGPSTLEKFDETIDKLVAIMGKIS